MPTVDWISGKVACTGLLIARLVFMLVTRLVCDREALNLLARVFMFSCALACHIRVAREFHEVTNKIHVRVLHTSVKFKSSGTVRIYACDKINLHMNKLENKYIIPVYSRVETINMRATRV